MDYIEGRSLAELIRTEPPSPKEAARIVKDVAEAVHYAHEEGIIHRDLKPSNILIDESGEVHVTDFGLAMRVEGDSDLTRTGQVLGTPCYMSPEQATAKRDLIGPATDVYSLGAVLYELLAGRPPFRGETAADTIRQLIDTEPSSPRQLQSNTPRDLETISLKCLEKDPRSRFGTAGALADDLGRFLADQPILARRTGVFARSLKWTRRNPFAAGLISVSLLTVLFGVGLSVSQWYQSRLTRANDELGVANNQLEVVNDQLQGANQALKAALTTAEVEKKSADRERTRARRYEYLSQIRYAELALANKKPRNAVAALEPWIPSSEDEEDLRGFEWHYLWRLCQGQTHTFQCRAPVDCL
ncbi:MAG: serine/threonine protein kinase, partial [Planctomycetales bacterium]